MLVNEQLRIDQLEDLGWSLKKAYSSVRKRVTSPIKKVIKVKRKIFKKVAPPRFSRFVSRVGKKGKAAFIKAAPWLAIAAQVLNFIPGLGLAVGVAITAGSVALQLSASLIAQHDAKKAFKEQEKADDAELQKLDSEVRAEENKATLAAMDAFIKGEKYFSEKYKMTRTDFAALPLEDKMAFLEKSITDLDPNAAKKVQEVDIQEGRAELAPDGQLVYEVQEEDSALPIPVLVAGGIAVAGLGILILLSMRRRS